MPETLDTLAEKVVALTTAVDRRFDAVDKRFDAVDKRFDAVDERFAAVDGRFDAADKRFDAADKRFDAVDKRFDVADKRIDAVDDRFDELKAELRTQIEAVDAKVALVLEKVDDLIKRDVRHSVAHARFDQRLDNHELRLLALESDGPPGEE